MKRVPSIFRKKKLDIEDVVFTHAFWMLRNHSRDKAVCFVDSLLKKYPKAKKSVLLRLSQIE